jgi:hypothetical protein
LIISPRITGELSCLGYAYTLEGRNAQAQKVLDQLKVVSNQKYVPAASWTIFYPGLGEEKDKSFEWLEKGYEGRSYGAIKVNPIYDPLRSHSRFQDLFRRMNLQPQLQPSMKITAKILWAG